MIHFGLHDARDSAAVVVVERVGAVANNFKGALAIPNSNGRLLACMLRTANGRLTAAKALGHREFVLTRLYESA